ncbi:MAG: hypothetical protein ORN54_00400, partial [Cyclobacteriaceae bacterium]|nr:hypothetical protein [Cyclobacteriaceae bacterium]
MKKKFPPTIAEPMHSSDHYMRPKKRFSIQIAILSLFFLVWFFSSFDLSAQDVKQRWVDSVFQKLSTTEKIGQLFMIPVSSTASNKIRLLSAQIKKYKPGSLLITKGSPIRHVRVMKKLQSQARVPMLTAIHAEQG